MRVAVLRCRNLPRFVTWEIPDVDALFADDRMLVEAFAEQGVAAEPVVWSDPGADWGSYDAAVIRSTWDYIDEPQHFLDVLARIDASSCRLFNGLDAVRWNSDKSYLFDLGSRGVPAVPTLRASSLTPAGFREHAVRLGWQGAVIKPILGVGASGVHRVGLGELSDALTGLGGDSSLDNFLVQPLVDSVTTEGEWSFIFIAGEFSHALLKRPAAGDFRSQSIYGATIESIAPVPGDIHQAEVIAAALPYDTLYARLDLVRIEGMLAVMELELIEPILYFDHAPGAATRLASATIARLAS